MKTPPYFRRQASPLSGSPASGFSLVEVLLALGLCAICLLTLLGLLSVGIRSDRTTLQQSVAANIAGAAMADLRATPLSTPSYTPKQVLYSPRFRFMLPASGTGIQTVYVSGDGTPLTEVNANLSSHADTYRVSVLGAIRPLGTGQRLASALTILVTWPGQADPTATTLPSHYAGSFQTVTYLDQN